MRNQVRKVTVMLLGALLAAPLFLQGAVKDKPVKPLAEQVRHELAMLPYYNVFDNLSFTVEGNQVILLGQVTWPTLKSDAENVVRSVPGVETVRNEIAVLPLSPADNTIRLHAYRAIYGGPGLQRYALGAVGSIHIIVNNGNITLEGVVGSEMDKNLAYMQANGVPGVFSVTNNLRVSRA